MNARRRIDSNILWVVALGFAMAILFLLASSYLGIRAIARTDERAGALVFQQGISARLVDEILMEDASLSNLFYLVASGRLGKDRQLLSQRLMAIEKQVDQTLAKAQADLHSDHWASLQAAVRDFIGELRRLLEAPGERVEASDELYRLHEALLTEASGLLSANYQGAVRAQEQEQQRNRANMRGLLVLLFLSLAMSVICAAGTLYLAARAFHRMDGQAKELSRLSAHVLDTQETIVQRFSQELHDELGQTLTAIGANLAALPVQKSEQRARVEDCKLLVQDAISATREMSQLLRPSALDDFGLGPGIQWLAESFAQRTGIRVNTKLRVEVRLPEAVETHFFRIAQEALTNVARHSGATEVNFSLNYDEGRLQLTITDNGRGFQRDHRGTGFGLMGMRQRMKSVGGTLKVSSNREGVTLQAEVLVERVQEKSYSNSAG